MANIDLTRFDERKAVIEQINGQENYSRKRRAQRAFDIYSDIIEPYLMELLQKEFSQTSISQMRKCSSINISKRIVQEEANVYSSAPTRTFGNVNEREQQQLDNIYSLSMTNTKMLYLNRYYRLFNQAFLQVLPHNGIIETRVLGPHQLDVIPDEKDARIPYAYIQNVWPKDTQSTTPSLNQTYNANDKLNQVIADPNDRSAYDQTYVAWTADYQMKFNGEGDVLDMVENPIKRLNLIDVSAEKDYQFFINRGYPITDYALELAVDITDLSSIARMQGWAYAIVYSENPPQNLVVGPNQVLWMKLDPNKPEIQPRFEFVSPSPDLSGQLSVLQSKMRIFLASRNFKSKAIVGDGSVDQYTSGVDRLLSMVDKYESSREDIALFTRVEDQLFDLYRDWSNSWIEFNDERALVDELRISRINDQAWVDVKFAKPEAIQSASEKRDDMIKEIEAGLRSRTEAIMELREIDRETAEEVIESIDNDELLVKRPQPNLQNAMSQLSEPEDEAGEMMEGEDASAED